MTTKPHPLVAALDARFPGGALDVLTRALGEPSPRGRELRWDDHGGLDWNPEKRTFAHRASGQGGGVPQALAFLAFGDATRTRGEDLRSLCHAEGLDPDAIYRAASPSPDGRRQTPMPSSPPPLGPPPDSDTLGAPPPRPAAGPNTLWKNEAEALAALASFDLVTCDESADLFSTRYGLGLGHLESVPEVSDWRFGDPGYPYSPGVVYVGTTPDGKKSFKWKSLPGANPARPGKRESRFFFGDPASALVLPSPDPLLSRTLVVVAGEEKALAARVLGFSALCPLAGEKANPDSPEKALWAPWIAERCKSGQFSRVILANDGNDASRAGEICNLAWRDALLAAGVSGRRLAVVVWPPDAPPGADLTDLFRDSGPDALLDFLQSAPLVAPPPPHVSLVGLLGYADDPRDLLIGDPLSGLEILARGPRYMLLSGAGGVGKSRVAVQLMLDLALGREDWFGIPLAQPRDEQGLPILIGPPGAEYRPGYRCLYVQSENSPRRLKRDLLAFLAAEADDGRRISPHQLDYLHDRIHVTPVGDSYGYALDVDRDGLCPGADALAALVETTRPDYVFMDPLADFLGAKSENDNAEVKRALIRFVTAVASGAKAAGILHPGIVIVHHGKASKQAFLNASSNEGKEGPRGATAIVNQAMSVFTISPLDLDSERDETMDNTFNLALTCTKVNDGKPPCERVIAYSGGRYSLVRDFDLRGYKAAVKNGDKPSRGGGIRSRPAVARAVSAITSIMQGKPNGEAVVKATLIEALGAAGIGRSMAFEGVKALAEEGLLAETKIGRATMILWMNR